MNAESVSALFSSTYFGLIWGLRAERSGVIAVETLGSVDSLISVWTCPTAVVIAVQARPYLGSRVPVPRRAHDECVRK
jgi:hypothetical protein